MEQQTYVVEFSNYKAILAVKETTSPVVNRGDVIEMSPFVIPEDSADMSACLWDYRYFVQQVVNACDELKWFRSGGNADRAPF